MQKAKGRRQKADKYSEHQHTPTPVRTTPPCLSPNPCTDNAPVLVPQRPINEIPLAHYFGLNRRYARSINLTRDLDRRDAVQGYVPTERSLDALHRIFPTLVDGEEPSHRAWTMTGVYGTGKSAFAHYLLALCAPESSTVRQEAVAIAQSSFPESADDHQLIGAVPDKGLIRAAAAGQREPLAHTIARALVTGANSFWRREKTKPEDLFRQITDWEVELDSVNPTISDQSILRVVKELVTQAKTSLILVIDELGKNLEFAAHHQGINDLYLLQQIAEMELEGAHQVYFLGILHQSFAGYSERLTATEQSEWNKIQGRFEDIVFTESPSQMTRLIGQVIVSPEPPVVDSIHQMANQWFAALQPVLREHEVSASVLAAAYPLHPVTALVLPLLCVRYAQSDRSLFTFLTSDEPFGLKAFLDKTTVIESAVGDKMPTLQLHQVYDYFMESASGMASRGNVQRWLEIQGLVEDAKDLSPDTLKLFKTIGVLNLITATGKLRATPELVTLALCSQPDQDQEKAHWQGIIDDLLQRGLLTHRRQLDELRLWQGSDFNVEFAIRQQVEQDYDPLASVLTASHPLKPVVAQRHYTTTGTLRYFEQWYGDSRLDLTQVQCSDSSFDGLVVIWLDSQLPDAWMAERGQTMPTTTADGKPLVVVATTQLDLLRVRAREFRALGQVLRQAPELRTDKVAAKEIKHRLAEAEQLLDETLAQVLAPSAEGCRYWIAGESQAIGSDRQFQSTLSDLCDRAYHRSLILDNELINRRELTSQGAKARRELLEAMLEQGDRERLGFTGYGPEVAMYYSVLEASGIHRVEDDHWGFYPPPVTQTQTGPVNLTTAWEAIESFCFKSTEKQRSL
ncbi:MAG: hypothetical protein VKJ64_13225, partial [Leptolyngbyaceae bacterium]|nr:hypothetical protein [Leptolyngbyaceae bacterium]